MFKAYKFEVKLVDIINFRESPKLDFLLNRKSPGKVLRKFHNGEWLKFSVNISLFKISSNFFSFLADASVQLPGKDKIIVENKYWQLLHTSNGTFKMFNAYYDQRAYFKRAPLVRILAFINRVDPVVETYCHLWFDNVEKPFIVKTLSYKLIWTKRWGVNSIGFQPYLISCINPLAHQGSIPTSVSLVENIFEDAAATNNLRVINNLPENNAKKPFAVCVKDLDFMDDQTLQIIEWIEILSLLGADKIFIYVMKIHPNMLRTLKYYEAQGKVVIEMMSEPEGLPTRAESLTQWLQNDLIPLNDCLYKHMNEYNYLIPLDIDEIIVPSRQEDKTWMDLMQRVLSKIDKPRAAYAVRNVFFLLDNNHENEIQPDVPSHLTFLQHVYRAVNFSGVGVGVKSFQSTELVFSMHNHFPMERVGADYIDASYIDIEDAKLQHYRRGCENYNVDECRDFKENTVKDLTLWNLKDEIIAAVDNTVERLNALKDEFLEK